MENELPPTFLLDFENQRVVELHDGEQLDDEIARSEHTSAFVSGDAAEPGRDPA